MTQLYVLAQEHRALADKLADMDVDEQTALDTLEGEAGALEAKAISVAAVIRTLESMVSASESIEAEIAALRKSRKRRADWLRRYLVDNMKHAGIRRIECPLFVVALHANPKAVDVFDAEQIPVVYMRQPDPPAPAPDKAAIKEALLLGSDVPGCRLTAGNRVEIK